MVNGKKVGDGIIVAGPNELRFWLNVKPRSAREEFGLDTGGELRLKVYAPATDGKANEACIEFLARLLRVSRSSIEIVMGDKSRRKLIRIRGGEAIARHLQSAATAVAQDDKKRRVAADN